MSISVAIVMIQRQICHNAIAAEQEKKLWKGLLWLMAVHVAACVQKYYMLQNGITIEKDPKKNL